MIRTKNRGCSKYVADGIPFIANNLKGVDEGRFYVVYSYGWWILFAWDKLENQWYENEEKYSVSTSRQRSESNPYIISKLMKHEDLKTLIQARG